MKSLLPRVLTKSRQRVPSILKAMSEMENEMERWMQSPLGWSEELQGFDFSPVCNLKETSKEFIVKDYTSCALIRESVLMSQLVVILALEKKRILS